MPSTYSSLKFELIATGEQAGTWGNTTNINIGTAIEEAITGSATVTFTSGANTAIALTNTNAAQAARNLRLDLSGTMTTSQYLYVPAIEKFYIINNTLSNTVIVSNGSNAAATGTAVSVPRSTSVMLFNDGVNVTSAISHIPSLANVTITSGNVTVTNLTATTGNITTGNISSLTVTSNATIAGASITSGNATLTNLTATTANLTNANVTSVLTVAAGTNAAPSITTSGDTNTGIFFPAADTIAFTEGGVESMRIDSAGNLGLGVTPSAWSGVGPGILELRGNAYVASTSQVLSLVTNAFFNGTNWIYKTSANANRYETIFGEHRWFTAPSGTAGNAITFTQAMTLDASGNLGIGTSSPNNKLVVNGAIAAAGEAAAAISNGCLIDQTAGFLTRILNYSSTTGSAIAFYTGSAGTTTERMRIDASGNVGIGTSSPSFAAGMGIAINGGAGQARLVLKNNNTGDASTDGLQIGVATDSSAFIEQRENSHLFFATNAIERARITSGGDFLVGATDSTNTASTGVRCYSTGAFASTRSESTNSTGNMTVYSTGAAATRFYVGMGGTIYATSTTITAISDIRFKENIQDLDVGLDSIMALKPRKFDWKEGKGKDKKGDRGWIAQEFEQVFPEMIDTWLDPAPEGEEPYKAVNADLIPVLVKAIQELNAKVEAQAAEIAALKGNA